MTCPVCKKPTVSEAISDLAADWQRDARHELSQVDARLLALIETWQALPERLKTAVEAICFVPASSTVS